MTRLWLAPVCVLLLSGFGFPGGGSCENPVPPDPPVQVFPPLDGDFDIDPEGRLWHCLADCNGKPPWKHPETGEDIEVWEEVPFDGVGI